VKIRGSNDVTKSLNVGIYVKVPQTEFGIVEVKAGKVNTRAAV
jgi:hypothetical protein